MIFTKPTSAKSFQMIESHKERNLYTKIFAGYLFNDLIPEPEKRLQAFLDLLIRNSEKEEFFFGSVDKDAEEVKKTLAEFSEGDAHVSFDFHGDQLRDRGWTGDDGELADILIHGSKAFISVEVKFKSDWKFEKDIRSNQERIILYKEIVHKKPLQVLLVTESKWDNVMKKINQNKSQFALLKKSSRKLNVPLIVITWEDIMKIIDDKKVLQYLDHQIKDTGLDYMNQEEFHESYLKYLEILRIRMAKGEELIYRIIDYNARGKETGNPRRIFDVKDNVLYIEESGPRNIVNQCTEEELFVIYDHFEGDLNRMKFARPRKEKLLENFHNFIEFKRPILMDMLLSQKLA